MRWPEIARLISRIKAERPELTVEHHASAGTKGHWYLRIYCVRKPRRPVPESIATIYGIDEWRLYKELHPDPWCAPEESYHTNALGLEVNHRGESVLAEPPVAPPIAANEMLERLVALNRSDPQWRSNPEKVAEVAAAWGVRADHHGIIADYEVHELVRISGDCHASVLIARTGSGLYACGVAARWGDGSTIMEPSIGSVPYDSEFDAHRGAMKELIETLQVGRRGTKHHELRQLLLGQVRQRELNRGLFG